MFCTAQESKDNKSVRPNLPIKEKDNYSLTASKIYEITNCTSRFKDENVQTVEMNLKKINDSISKATSKGETNVSCIYPNNPFGNHILSKIAGILADKGYTIKKHPLVYGDSKPTNWRFIIDWEYAFI